MSDRQVQRYLGGLLLAVGVLIATLSGLCTVVFAFNVSNPLSGPNLLANAGVLLLAMGLFGGIPMAIGVGLAIAGRSLMKPPTASTRPDKPSPKLYDEDR